MYFIICYSNVSNLFEIVKPNNFKQWNNPKRSSHEYPWFSQKSEQGFETKEVSRNDSAAILNQSQKPVLEESKPEPTRIAGKYVTQEQRVEQERKQEQIAEQEQKQEKDAEQERLDRVRAARIALLNSGISPSFNSVSSTRSPPFKPIFQGKQSINL